MQSDVPKPRAPGDVHLVELNTLVYCQTGTIYGNNQLLSTFHIPRNTPMPGIDHKDTKINN